MLVPRSARQDAFLPLHQPIQSSSSSDMLREVYVPRGTDVLVGIRAINTDTRLWGEDAKEWKPQRWREGAPKAVTDANIPGVYANL